MNRVALEEANLFGSTLTGTNLCGANLKGANLTEANLDAVLWDEHTIWPDVEIVKQAKNIPEVLKQQLGIE